MRSTSQNQTINKVGDAIEAHKKYNTDLGVTNSKDAEATRTHAMVISSSVGLLLLVALVITGMRTISTLLGTLGGEPADVAAIARDVANGNLSSNVNLQQGDSTSLLATVAQMQTDLKARAEKERAAVTQQNAALVEEAASAAESLSEEAQHLDRMMANYQIASGSGSQGSGVPRPEPSPASSVEGRSATAA
jgi:methyl-accepting chemotaxis protein